MFYQYYLSHADTDLLNSIINALKRHVCRSITQNIRHYPDQCKAMFALDYSLSTRSHYVPQTLPIHLSILLEVLVALFGHLCHSPSSFRPISLPVLQTQLDILSHHSTLPGAISISIRLCCSPQQACCLELNHPC